jgi:hypothetical protein
MRVLATLLTILTIYLFVVRQPRSGLGRLIVQVSISNTIKHTHNRWDSSERVITTSQRLLPTQQTKEANIHVLSGIRTRDPNNLVAADLRLRPHDHRDRQFNNLHLCIAKCISL